MTDSQHVEGPRGTRAEDFDALMQLLNDVFRQHSRTMAQEHGYIYCLDNAEYLRIVLCDGRPVSHFGTKLWEIEILGMPLLMASIGGVCTHADFRGKGFATLLLKDAEALFRRRGVDIVLVSGGRGLYQTNGYAPFGRCCIFELDQHFTELLQEGSFRIREYSGKDFAALGRIYEGEKTRYRRPMDEMKKLVAGRLARPEPDRFVIVSREGLDLAWFVVSTGVDGKTPKLWEYAGDRAAVLAGLAAFMRTSNMGPVTAWVPAHDSALVARFQSLGLACRMESIPEHTVKILDFRSFMEKMRPLFRERVGETLLAGIRFENSGAGGVIHGKDGTVALADPHLVAKVVFGSPTSEEAAVTGAATGDVREFLTSVFPLPFVSAGMNYV